MPDAPRRKTLSCAIYTRKSSEEGLEQDFNSLHAQREACEAYVVSQKHEGWKALPGVYDDGGYSGGTLERPALQKLLADIAAGEIDVVVVYKVDRLTRALADFAKIIEIFDRHGVSFVSVTQAFNTTSSMGRLTLNVLLSFAQFEREVTGERIRDKIAASKKKGMWMGGYAPLGYSPHERTLVIVEPEAETVRTIYRLYLDLKTVDRVKQELDRLGLRTKQRSGSSDRMTGGLLFGRGHLYRILSNPLYVGRINHKGQTYDGLHPAIVDQATWDEVQAVLKGNSHARLVKAHSKDPSLLAGRLIDELGETIVATHATKQGKRYRYYISASLLNRGRCERPLPTDPAVPASVGLAPAARSARAGPAPRRPTSDTATRQSARVWRLPASEIEGTVIRVLAEILTDEHWLSENVTQLDSDIRMRRAVFARCRELASQLQGNEAALRRGVIFIAVERIVLHDSEIEIALWPSVLAGDAESKSERKPAAALPTVTVMRKLTLRRRGSEVRLIIEGDAAPVPEPDGALTKGLAQAHRWWQDLLDRRYPTIRELAAAYDTNERYVASVVRLAFLPAALTRAILDGTQQAEMTLHAFLKG